MRHRTVRVSLEGLNEQLFGARYISWNRCANSATNTVNQDPCEADARVGRAWIDFQRALEGVLSLFVVISVDPRPPAHYEISRIWIDRILLLASASLSRHKFNV